MRRKLFSGISLIVAFWVSGSIVAQRTTPLPEPKSNPPLVRAHAHNDYEHARPLLDALEQGFCSIEADVWLVDGRLLVAHDRDKVRPERTLEALYLDPLRERVRAHGGRVYHGGPGVILLVDVKSEGEATYSVLREILKSYSDMLSACRGGAVATNAVTVIVSGNRAPKTMAAEPLRYAFVDGRMADLENGQAPSLIPLVSDNWGQVFEWRWSGPMPEADRTRLKQIVERTHSQGRKLRFWATPDNADAWKILFDAGVDLINTDDLEGLRRFLGKETARKE